MLSFNWNNTSVTVELGELVDSGVNIWDFPYPTPRPYFDVNGKTVYVPFNQGELEDKIVDHYRFRQIGQETVGRWLHYFRARMREIMPKYCQMYEFEAIWRATEDPLESYNLVETFEQTSTGSGTQTSSGSSENTSESSGTSDKENRFSDTPQGSIENLDNYLTTATKDNETSTGTATVTGSDTSESSTENTGTTTHTLTRRGNIGVQPLGSEVKDIRSAFIDIDIMIINDLKDLFLQVY